MTNDALDEIDTMIKAWRVDHHTALREGDAERARDCRLLIANLEYLRSRILAKAA